MSQIPRKSQGGITSQLLPWLAVLAVLVGVYGVLADRPLKWRPGVLINSSPLQQPLAEPVRLTRSEFPQAEGYQITARASFTAEARVLGREPYYLGPFAEVSPLDLAVGWGVMSDSAFLERLRIRQSGRFFRWRAQDIALDTNVVNNHSANWHILPARGQVRDELKRLRVGDLIEISGYLVDIDGPDGWKTRTSLTRDDTGDGACEVIWVEKLKIKYR